MSKKFLDYIIRDALSAARHFDDKHRIEMVLMTILSFFAEKCSNIETAV